MYIFLKNCNKVHKIKTINEETRLQKQIVRLKNKGLAWHETPKGK